MSDEFKFALDLLQEPQFEYYHVRTTWPVISNKTGERYKVHASLRSATIRLILNTYS